MATTLTPTDPHTMTDAEYETYINAPENGDAWWITTAALQEAMDPDAGRDIGEPDTDPRDFRAFLSDYLSDAESVYRATPTDERDTLNYRNGLYQAALEITARYLQEHDDGQLY